MSDATNPAALVALYEKFRPAWIAAFGGEAVPDETVIQTLAAAMVVFGGNTSTATSQTLSLALLTAQSHPETWAAMKRGDLDALSLLPGPDGKPYADPAAIAQEWSATAEAVAKATGKPWVARSSPPPATTSNPPHKTPWGWIGAGLVAVTAVASGWYFLGRTTGPAGVPNPAGRGVRQDELVTALGTLAHNRGFSAAELAEYMRIDARAARRHVKRLVEVGLVERRDDGLYFPTPDGWRWIEAYSAPNPVRRRRRELGRFTLEQAKAVGDAIGIDWGDVNLEEFRRGLAVELEHGTHDPETNITNDDLRLTGKIAWAHLKELSDYYSRLEMMEHEARRA
jgi:DNA-binding transcriptional ArsR family regulator